MSIRLSLRHRRHDRPALGNPCRTGCACAIAHAITPEAAERVRDAIALARINGETDLVSHLEMRLDTSKCPAAQALVEVR